MSRIEIISISNNHSLRCDIADLIKNMSKLEKLIAQKNTTVVSDKKEELFPTDYGDKSRIAEIGSLNKPISQVRNLPLVKKGSFKINGIAVSVNPDIDSLSEIMHKIDSIPDISVFYGESESEFKIKSDDGGYIAITEDETGIVPELNIKEGVYAGSTEFPEYGASDSHFAEEIVLTAESVAGNVENILNSVIAGDEFIVDKLEEVFLNYDNSQSPGQSRYWAGLGLSFNKDSGDFELNGDIMNKMLRDDSEEVVDFFKGKDGKAGFIKKMYEAIREMNGRAIDIVI